MSIIDEYLKNVEPDKRTELERIRSIALDSLPGGEETLFYGMPCIKLHGKAVLSFDAHKNHIGIYPNSGSVISKIPELSRYPTTAGAIQEHLDDLLSEALIRRIIDVRLGQIDAAGTTDAAD